MDVEERTSEGAVAVAAVQGHPLLARARPPAPPQLSHASKAKARGRSSIDVDAKDSKCFATATSSRSNHPHNFFIMAAATASASSSTLPPPPTSYSARPAAPLKSKTKHRIDLAELTPNNVGQLRKLNSVLFPVRYSEAFYKDALHEDKRGINKLGEQRKEENKLLHMRRAG